MKKPYNFAEYNLINDSKQNNTFYKSIVIIFIIVIVVLICKFKFYVYEKSVLIKNNNNYLLAVDINYINEISTTGKIIINRKEYDYEISKVEDNLENINGTFYETLYLNINNYNKKDKIVNCYFLKSKKTLLDSLLEFTKGG